MAQFRILVVDDDRDDQFLIQQAAKIINPDVEIITVENGVKAMDFLLSPQALNEHNRLRLDLIITDINMPLLNGFELIEKIKQNPYLKDIPIFVLSTSFEEKTKTKCLNLGAWKLFAKPENRSQYNQLIKDILANCGIQV